MTTIYSSRKLITMNPHGKLWSGLALIDEVIMHDRVQYQHAMYPGYHMRVVYE